MVYVSRRRKFHDFIKNRNNAFYIILILVVVLLAAAGVIIATTQSQKDNKVVETTSEEQSETYSESETVSDNIGKYLLRINAGNFTVSAYSYDAESGDYSTSAERVMSCALSATILRDAAGQSTVTVTETPQSYRISWENYGEASNYRYVTSFTEEYAFHTANYTVHSDKTSLDVADYNTIGKASANSGITLAVADAKWIYENCSFETTVEIYSDASTKATINGATVLNIPEEYAEIYTTDPSDETTTEHQWCPDEIATFDCPTSFSHKGAIDNNAIFKRMTILDSAEHSLTEYAIVRFTGYYNYAKAGTYHFTVYIADVYGNFHSQEVEMTLIDDGSLQEETESVTESEPEEATKDDAETTEEITGDKHTDEESISEASDEETEPETEEDENETATEVDNEVTEDATEEATKAKD